jgi:hypothetical protein
MWLDSGCWFMYTEFSRLQDHQDCELQFMPRMRFVELHSLQRAELEPPVFVTKAIGIDLRPIVSHAIRHYNMIIVGPREKLPEQCCTSLV